MFINKMITFAIILLSLICQLVSGKFTIQSSKSPQNFLAPFRDVHRFKFSVNAKRNQQDFAADVLRSGSLLASSLLALQIILPTSVLAAVGEGVEILIFFGFAYCITHQIIAGDLPPGALAFSKLLKYQVITT